MFPELDPPGRRRTPLDAAVLAGIVLRLLASLVWLLWGLRLFTAVPVVPGAAAAGLGFVAGGVLLLPLAVVALPPRIERAVDAVLLVGTLVALALWTQQAIYASPAYGTDEIAFGQGAAQALLAGHDPYAVNLGWTLTHFQVPPVDMTTTLSGALVTRLSYPALSFLLYVPLLALGVHPQAANYMDAAFWGLAILALWFTLPRPWRLTALIVGSLGVYIGQVTGGILDALFVPFAILALWRWDRFSDPTERSIARWVGPVALGLGCAVQQSLWFLVPFLCVAIALEARGAGRPWVRRVLRYAGLLAAAFLIPNLPFVVWGPRPWILGTVLPFVHGLVPLGQGLVAVSLYLARGSGDLVAYTIAAVCVWIGLLALTVAAYPQVKRALPILPALVLLFPTRSLSNYFLFLIPGLLVASLTVADAPVAAPATAPGARRGLRWAAGAGLAGGGLALVLGITSPPPLQVHLLAEQTTGQLGTVDAVTLVVRNETGRTVEPHFTVGLGPYMSTVWIVRRGPRRLAGHAQADYELWAPGVASMPSVGETLVVYGLTPRPAAVSVLRAEPPDVLHVQIEPAAIARAIPRDGRVRLAVTLLTPLDQPRRRAGIVVDLGQVVYAEGGVFPGETAINGHAEGQSPVAAVTNRDGIAHFTIRAVQVQPDAVFYQAWLARPYARGFSNLVSLRFVAGGASP
ncbi:MAG TPA: hypothetical protein VNN74_11590 [Candidatus Micrarchaeia archaeon]|nr:hypothetical protein [Candidatus Micrarchaeia archaeon]